MYVWHKMFIIVAIIYHSCAIVSSESNNVSIVNCDCDVLQITSPSFSVNFTKQNGLISKKPYYFSMRRNLISWSKQKWFHYKYNSEMEMFYIIQQLNENFFSFEKTCKNVTRGMNWKGKDINITSQCLRHNSKCLATKELNWYRFTGFTTKEIKLQAKNPCKFPFIYKNVTYNSCTNQDARDKFWCATSVNATNHKTSWGYCNCSCDICPKGKDIMLKDGEDVSSEGTNMLKVGEDVFSEDTGY